MLTCTCSFAVSRRALATHAEFDHAVLFIFLQRIIFKSHRLLLSTASIITATYLDRLVLVSLDFAPHPDAVADSLWDSLRPVMHLFVSEYFCDVVETCGKQQNSLFHVFLWSRMGFVSFFRKRQNISQSKQGRPRNFRLFLRAPKTQKRLANPMQQAGRRRNGPETHRRSIASASSSITIRASSSSIMVDTEDAVAAADKEMEERAARAKALLSNRYKGLRTEQVRKTHTFRRP